MRSVDEWIGENDDTQIPPRVKLRIYDRCHGRCAVCTRLVAGSLLPVYDHIVALANGGENREGNIQLLCSVCHRAKTTEDVALKSATYNKRAKRLRLKRRRLIPGSKGSGFRKKMDGTVVREP